MTSSSPRLDPAGRSATPLYFVFFLSGAAALIFETLWFRLASLVLGNSVWASSLVLSSFMAGLALGNALAGTLATRVRRAVRAYAALELAVAIAGIGLVFGLPTLEAGLAPFLGPLLDRPLPLNAARFAVSFALLVVPATAMGASLPLLVKELVGDDPSFGRVLGRLYGWNTLGGVTGCLVAETWLIGELGIRGAGVTAGSLDLIAAAVALRVARRTAGGSRSGEIRLASPRSGRLLLAAALCGATLLALEVVWFRFLLLFVTGTSLAFALMLAVVLAGIGLGGLGAGQLLARRPEADRWLPLAAWAAAFLVVLGYVDFDRALRLVTARNTPLGILVLAGWLAFPTSLASGAIFTLIGRALGGDETRATARLTLANTLGGMLGAGCGAWLLLPILGMERATFAIAAAYLLAGLLCIPPTLGPTERRSFALAGLAASAFWLLFPFGIMETRYLRGVRAEWDLQGAMTLVALREGRSETIQYLRQDLLGQPLAHRLITNNYSMSGTSLYGRRYMRLFVYWALAMRPETRNALLISYGVGVTAKALTDAPQLERIDVVDSSAEILELAGVPFPAPETSPLQDPRVRVHVEDGRFFLQTSTQQFDLITGEPPPLNAAGIVNLYTREYFRLMRERLTPEGVATYWLPVYQIPPAGARSAIRAFCDVFPDCTLWTGASLEWMLAGSRGAGKPVRLEAFSRQWRAPATARAMEAVGFEVPEMLGATFLADADQLQAFVGDAAPVVDDFPQRLAPARGFFVGSPEYAAWTDADAARLRFATSRFIRDDWPPELREPTLESFRWQRLVNQHLGALLGLASTETPDDVAAVLNETRLRALPLWLLGLTSFETAIQDRAIGALPKEVLARRALAERRFDDAARLAAAALAEQPGEPRLVALRELAARLAPAPKPTR